MSTLTPVLNEEREIRGAVAALQAQDLAGETEFIFIDGRSTDRTRAILEELAGGDGRIGILDNPARHTAAGLNIGLRAARGEYVARIDAHARYPRSYLSRGIDRLRQGDVDWVSGPQIPVGTDAWSRRIALALGTSFATGGSNRWRGDAAHHGGGEIELETGVFVGMWRRTTLERHGGWDEGWPINQDSEMRRADARARPPHRLDPRARGRVRAAHLAASPLTAVPAVRHVSREDGVAPSVDRAPAARRPSRPRLRGRGCARRPATAASRRPQRRGLVFRCRGRPERVDRGGTR